MQQTGTQEVPIALVKHFTFNVRHLFLFISACSHSQRIILFLSSHIVCDSHHGIVLWSKRIFQKTIATDVVQYEGKSQLTTFVFLKFFQEVFNVFSCLRIKSLLIRKIIIYYMHNHSMTLHGQNLTK